MLQKVQAYVRARAINKEKAHVLVALSGGADSVCLLHVMVDLGYEVEAAHCNFHLRGDESDRDEAFVRALCETVKTPSGESLHIPLYVKHFDTTAYAREHGVSIEMAARDLRYAWFEELRQQIGADVIAVAHHMNDQAETLLLNLRRGTGVHGLAGMKPVNGKIVRPLLCVTRREIEEYAQANGYRYVVDSTNSDTRIQRNAVRALLSSSTDAEIEHMAHTAELVQEYDSLLQALLWGTTIPKQSERTLLYELLAPYGFNATQVENILSALPSSGKHFEAENYTAEIDHGELHIRANATESDMEKPVVLRAVRPRMPKEHFPDQEAMYALFDADHLPENLMLRHWKEGDSFLPIANKSKAVRKKLQDFFSNLKLSVSEKNRVWLLCNADKQEEIVWVVGYRISDPYKLTDATTRVAEIEVE